MLIRVLLVARPLEIPDDMTDPSLPSNPHLRTLDLKDKCLAATKVKLTALFSKIEEEGSLCAVLWAY